MSGFSIADMILYVAFRSETNSTPCHCGLEFTSFQVPLLFSQSFCSQVSDCRAMPTPTVGVLRLFGLTCLKLHPTLLRPAGSVLTAMPYTYVKGAPEKLGFLTWNLTYSSVSKVVINQAHNFKDASPLCVLGWPKEPKQIQELLLIAVLYAGYQQVQSLVGTMGNHNFPIMFYPCQLQRAFHEEVGQCHFSEKFQIAEVLNQLNLSRWARFTGFTTHREFH